MKELTFTICILEMHNTIVCQLVFDQWHSLANVFAQEYILLEMASKSKEPIHLLNQS